MFPQPKSNKQLKNSLPVYPQLLYLAKYQIFFCQHPKTQGS